MAYNKKVQSRYKKKITQYKVQYSLSDNDRKESDRLKAYLAETGQSANSYIKALIKSDLDNKGIPYPDNTDNIWSQLLYRLMALYMAFYGNYMVVMHRYSIVGMLWIYGHNRHVVACMMWYVWLYVIALLWCRLPDNCMNCMYNYDNLELFCCIYNVY